jgi:hypothetical protein
MVTEPARLVACSRMDSLSVANRCDVWPRSRHLPRIVAAASASYVIPKNKRFQVGLIKISFTQT